MVADPAAVLLLAVVIYRYASTAKIDAFPNIAVPHIGQVGDMDILGINRNKVPACFVEL